MNKWPLFIISIGLLIIASSPMFKNQVINIIMGALVIGIGIILFKKSKKG
ncbi:LPXTG cell wall anchor domain-containing protein [Senegalia massiliensis]|uniref:LPXTG cell wall anchor domain-containing protein n=1 Tax=Senegalia massiliensis TaxID=1720316 RepID=A0A845QY67_9CLOT|nr:LPXTG cell wall anchor domain-containing protein [Senegalia massiliensis]NBI07211.1 LPXTG cell wall anchor domain-containing protein [Senegalia massiliensis]